MTVAFAPRPKVKLRVEDFDLLAESGGLAGLERTELLDGDIYLISPQYSRHAVAKALLHETLLDWKRANRPDLVVLTETSVAMPPNDEPMPDVTLCARPRGRKGIAVETVLLLVEISNDSAEYDLGYKAELYARQGVPEYWVVDLSAGALVLHAEPGADGYGQVVPIVFGKDVASATLDGLTVDTRALLD